MSVDVQKERKRMGEQANQQEEPRPSLLTRFRAALEEIDWKLTMLAALFMAAGWCLLFLSFNILQVLAGIVPVTTGLWLGRRVKKQLLLHGIILGINGYLLGIAIVAGYGYLGDIGVLPPLQIPDTQGNIYTVSWQELVVFYMSFSTLAMIPFPAFGAVMSGRAEQRQQEMRKMIEERGGELKKPTPVRTLDDLQGLSLPQLGSYVNNLFQKQGFKFEDYRFVDKDKHLDLQMSYQDEYYMLRLSVADKVRPGTIESLTQEMKQRKILKGLVITSTEFTPDALKSVKGRQNIVAIDGSTLFDITER